MAFPLQVRGWQLLCSRLCSLLNHSNVWHSFSFHILFFSPSVQSNVWFCFSPPHNKIKTISNRRTCRKGRFFSHLLLRAWVWKDHVSPGSCLAAILDVGRLGKVHEGVGEHPECGLVTLMKPLVTWFCWAGRSVCCHKLHPWAGSQAIQAHPKVFSCELGKETAGKTSLRIIFNPVSQDHLYPNVSLVPCSKGMRWSGLHLVN